MSTITYKVPTINELLTMPTTEILQLLTENHRIMEFSKIFCRAELYDTIFPKLKDSISELFQSTEVNEISSLICMIISTVSDTVDLTLDNSMEALQSLAIGVLDLVLQLYKLIYKSELEINVEGINLLRSKLIGILISNDAKCFPDYFSSIDVTFVNRRNLTNLAFADCNINDEIKFELILVIFILCEMAEFAFKTVEPRFSAEVWRCITIVCTGKLSKSVNELMANQDKLIYMEFLLTAVKKCCFCIQSGIQKMCESPDQHIEIFYGKTMLFIINILQRLAATYPHDKFQGHEHVLTTSLMLMRTVRTIKQPNQYLNQNSVFCLQNILFLICESNEFTECFYRASNDEFSTEVLHLGLEILKKITSENNSILLQYFMNNEDANIVYKLLKCSAISQISTVSKNPMCKKLIVKLSSLLIETLKTTNSHIPIRLLVKSLLESNNSATGYLLLDLWNTWARYLPEVQCYNLVLFWSEINDKFSIVKPINLQSVHVKIILQNLYDNLSDSYKLKFRQNKPLMSNIKLWASLGLHRITNEIGEIMDLHIEIESLVAHRTHSAYNKLIEHLRLLATMSSTTETTVPDYLIKLWKLNFNQQTNKYSPLIIPLIRISITYNKTLSNSQHFHILQKLNGIASTPNVKTILKFEILNYLRHTAIKYFTIEYQNDIMKSIRQLFNRNFIDLDPLVRQMAFTIYGQVIVEAQHENLTPNDITDDESLKMELYNFISRNNTLNKTLHEQMEFLGQLSTYSSQHQCVELEFTASDDDGFRRNDSIDIKIKEIIDRMQFDIKELKAFHRDNKLTNEFFANIEDIRQELLLIQK